MYFFHQRNRIYEERGGSFKGTWRKRSAVCGTAENISGKGNAVLYLELPENAKVYFYLASKY